MLMRFAQVFIETFCRLAFDKTTVWQHEQDTSTQTTDAQDGGVYCAVCNTRVTQHEHAWIMNGDQRHRFINPGGIEFEIVLYRQATAEHLGVLTEQYTWFPGYAWQVITCTQCRTHLGWYYWRAHSPDFYGLIAHRIEER